MEPIDLIEKYQNTSCEQEFNEYSKKIEGFTNFNSVYKLKTGDIIHFLNGYDVPMISKILGFNKAGKAFLLWDCYWFPVDLETSFVKVLSNI